MTAYAVDVTTTPAESRTHVRDLGIPKTDLDTSLQLAGALEDEQIIRRMADDRRESSMQTSALASEGQ